MKPAVRIAIQYEPRKRGLYLAIGYCRIRRGSDAVFDIYGAYEGYCGGGAYGDGCFHVVESAGEGFTTFTYGLPGSGWWLEDRIGVSGSAGRKYADGVGDLLDLVQHRLYTRWCSYTEGVPDLTRKAKRFLNCERRRVCYASPGFDSTLLEFLSPKWGLSLSFRRGVKKL